MSNNLGSDKPKLVMSLVEDNNSYKGPSCICIDCVCTKGNCICDACSCGGPAITEIQKRTGIIGGVVTEEDLPDSGRTVGEVLFIITVSTVSIIVLIVGLLSRSK